MPVIKTSCKLIYAFDMVHFIMEAEAMYLKSINKNLTLMTITRRSLAQNLIPVVVNLGTR